MTTYARYYLGTGDPPEPAPIEALDLETLTVQEIGRQLRAELERIDEGHEYWGVCTSLSYGPDGTRRLEQPIGPYRWLACYAVTGTSEGHYIHVDRIWSEPYAREYQHEPLYLGKTFGGYAAACKVAAYVGARLGA